MEDLNDLFKQDVQKKEKDLDVLKELFQIENIETKSELNVKQIVMINQKRMISKMLGWESLNDSLNDFMLLMVSNQRKGRNEFVEGFKSEREHNINQQQGGFFNRLKNQIV